MDQSQSQIQSQIQINMDGGASKKSTSTSNKLLNINYPYAKTWDKEKNYATFEIKNIKNSLANSLRRVMMVEVPTVGFKSEPYEESKINIIQNDSPLHNQFLAHRIAMIPLNIPFPEKFDTDDYEFIIDVYNDSNFPKDVTSNDIKIRKISDDRILQEETTRKMLPLDPITEEPIVITRLKPEYYQYGNINNANIISSLQGESQYSNKKMRLYVTAKANISTGQDNGHYSPVSCSVFTNKVDPEKAALAEKQFIEEHNEKMANNELTPSTPAELKRRFEVSLKERHFYTDKTDEPYHFEFKIESVGVIPPLVIFSRAISILKDKITNFRNDLMQGNENKIIISPSSSLSGAFQVVIKGEDDTLGNVIQSYFNQLYCSYNDNNRLLNYFGYIKPHPLVNEIHMTVQPSSGTKSFPDLIETIFNPGCMHIIRQLNSISVDLEKSPQFISEMKKI
tara:strand:+ start:3692 stop:5047 length:1356 start_codon:yes stop_codon:yes gene_type:complete